MIGRFGNGSFRTRENGKIKKENPDTARKPFKRDHIEKGLNPVDGNHGVATRMHSNDEEHLKENLFRRSRNSLLLAMLY